MSDLLIARCGSVFLGSGRAWCIYRSAPTVGSKSTVRVIAMREERACDLSLRSRLAAGADDGLVNHRLREDLMASTTLVDFELEMLRALPPQPVLIADDD